MSEVKLVIRDANEDRSGTVHGCVAEWFIAALSADPVSLTELDAAVDRFALASPDRGHFTHFRHAIDAEPWDAGLVVVDMEARLVVIDSSYSSPGRQGVITRHNVESVEGGTVDLSYRLADDWQFLHDATSWEGTAHMRRQKRANQPVIDLREIFYGEPMLRSIIDGCQRQFPHRDEIARRVHLAWIESRRHWNERYAQEPQPEPETLTMHELARREDPADDLEHSIYYDTIRDIHADWLMTPCAELNDQLPRTVLLQDRDRLSGDMSDREHHWSMLERCPPGISPESHAFQFGGFNTSEIVMYYNYVREVAWSCWDRLRTMSDTERAALETSQRELGAFVRDEVIRLRKVGGQWLDAPWDEDPMRTPRGIINLERRRQPNGGQFHPIDPDCPCCQALAAMPGIGFWHMDGCNMDDLFAFAYYHETIESWERDQADYRELSEQIDQEWDLAKEWGLPPQYSEPTSHFGEVWRLIVKDATGEIPLGKRLNKVAHNVVSLVVRLRIAAKHDADLVLEQIIETLMSEYAPLRQACEESTDQELSRNVQPNATRLLTALDKLTTHLERYLSESEEDESADDREPDFSPQPPLGFRWRKVLRVSKELRHVLQSLTDIAEETPNDGWYADDVPF
ncbi:MAG TPA: hypothetical protein PLR25_21875 [Planctomycetaceae bacterium]|nr:hypothetical protein [Planctomycetaceae bacterium]